MGQPDLSKVVPLTPAQREALGALAVGGGEAIRQTPWFEVAGNIICGVDVMGRLERKRMVRVETVGASAFAIITERGRLAVAETSIQ